VKTFIERLADCIDRQEGKDQNNNPGNLWDGITSGKPHRIWPDIPRPAAPRCSAICASK